jgi:nicotinamidase/pyrazinamidase
VKTVFFDIDTQIDFMYPTGALYVPGAERIVPTIAELNRHAPFVISTMCKHSEDDPEFHAYPHHCVVDTVGQRKPCVTLIEKCEPPRQVILEKQVLDCFSNPRLQPLLSELGAERCIVYGVVTEICVRLAAFGLLKTGRRVEIVTDAVQALDEKAAHRMFTEFSASGGRLTTRSAVLAESFS